MKVVKLHIHNNYSWTFDAGGKTKAVFTSYQSHSGCVHELVGWEDTEVRNVCEDVHSRDHGDRDVDGERQVSAGIFYFFYHKVQVFPERKQKLICDKVSKLFVYYFLLDFN